MSYGREFLRTWILHEDFHSGRAIVSSSDKALHAPAILNDVDRSSKYILRSHSMGASFGILIKPQEHRYETPTKLGPMLQIPLKKLAAQTRGPFEIRSRSTLVLTQLCLYLVSLILSEALLLLVAIQVR